MKLKINKVSVLYLNSLIKRMLLMDSAVYINITNERVWSDVYTQTKDIVKSYSIPTKDVFEFEKPFEGVLKLSFFSGSKLLSCVSNFDPHNLTAELSLFKDGDEGVMYADKITLKDNRLKIDVNCQDISLGFTSMTEVQVKNAFNEDSQLFTFTLGAEDLSKMTSLFSLDRDELFQIIGAADGVHIKTESFDMIIDDRISVDNIQKQTFKGFFEKVDKDNYTVSVCENKLIFTSQTCSTKMALNLAITS